MIERKKEKINFLYPQLHSFIKWQPNTTAGQNLYRTLSLHIYGGGNLYLDRDMEKLGRSDHFPEGTGCTSWFFIMIAFTKLKGAFRLSSPDRKKKKKLKSTFCIFKGNIWTNMCGAFFKGMNSDRQ